MGRQRCSGTVALAQPAPRSAVRLAWVDPVKVPDPRGRLEAALGGLDLFELIGPWPVKVRDAPYLAQTASGLTLRWW